MALPERIRILMVEDMATDAELEVRELRRSGLSVEHKLVDTEQGFQSVLPQFNPHLIISDFSMPHFDGMAALALARELAPHVPFIFVSGTIGEEYAIRALKNGATDYVLKTNLVRLPAAVERALEDAKKKNQLRSAEHARAESEAQLRLLADNVPAMIAYTDAEHLLRYANRQFIEFYGGRSKVTTGLNLSDLVGEARSSEVRGFVEHALGGEAQHYEFKRVDTKGSERDIDASLIPHRQPDGKVTGVYTFMLDVTERKEREEKLARLARIRDVLGAVNAACMRIRERKTLFEEFCRIAVSRGGFMRARFVEVLRNGTLTIVANTEGPGSAFASIVAKYNSDPARAQSLLATAMRSGQITVSNDLAAEAGDPDRAALTRDGNYSVVVLPVRVEGAVVAAATLNAEPQFFDQEELAVLSELVANLELALELEAKQEKVDYLALYDPLTALPNRTLFQDRLTQALEAARRGSTMLALGVFDIERFKAINDTLGQRAGDEVLRIFAERMKAAVGDVNRVARLGGNSFGVMFPAIQDAPDAARVLEETSAELTSRPLAIEGKDIQITTKAGIALFPDDGADAAALFRNAEASLKRAKETGDRFLFYAPHINARVAEQVDLEARLRQAVEKRELFLHYQPKVSMETNQIIGVEALMRWRGPDNLQMSPAKFVPVLEETGMILEAGRQALEMAATAFRDWKTQGLKAPRIAVNVSALQLRQKSFVDDVRAALGTGDSGVDLEVTESLLMEDIEESIRKLRTLREAGSAISLDDFGTGHSSLAYLSRLPIDLLKIDRSFVRGMTENADHTSIVSTIISLAQALRLKTVAEGVETDEQARLLRLLRCDLMQGYLYSPPVAKEKLEEMLRAAPG